ncbi:PREDICTED: 28S ribosomal protein S28, mitochondrial [Vollenhovia emeryi]|uniref:28S ribosomal protein S28, mitochondrial n=1 Tax=Vollenhovia emeryi TaxID=411798 RepID=UPI0005F496DA|nr:PREDICTED: 28S ribosomal protein S28, mitochondrial [Vollenhovia emeryi]
MNKIHRLEALMHLRALGVPRANSRWLRTTRVTRKENAEAPEFEAKLSGFARSYDKFSRIDEKPPETVQSFASLVRNSKFVDLGDPEGKVVTGEIFHVVGDDLYIDFGWKFNCICRKPVKNGEYYVRGSKVRLKVKDLELSSRFLGAVTDITLLEADCVLIGLISSPLQAAEQKPKTIGKPRILDLL